MLLHTVNKSPFERNAFDSCLRHAVRGSAVLLIEDAVYAAVKGNDAARRLADEGQGLSLFVLGPDLNARGLGSASLVDGVTVVDYGGFVDLAARYEAVQAWL